MAHEGGNPHKAFAPAAERNREAIGDAIADVLPDAGLVLEIASGTGQHIEYLAARFPALEWQPSDISRRALSSIEARAIEYGRPNFLRPLRLDVTRQPWPLPRADAILCVNMIHIAPWEATLALFAGAERLLEDGGVLVTYGPYRVHGQTAPSNEAFDQSLRAQDPTWGVRDIDDLEHTANTRGFDLMRTIEMPANNLTLVWTKGSRQADG